MKQDEIVKETDPRSYRLAIEASKDNKDWVEIYSIPVQRFESPKFEFIRLRVISYEQANKI